MPKRPPMPGIKGQQPRPKTISPRLKEMLRVDHAGEYGAVAIYKGQQAIFGKNHKTREIAAKLAEMEAEEQHHLDAFDDLLNEHKVRPTALAPIWNVAGFGLGVVTALMGEKAAHACTEAVETVIEKHYADQIDELEGDAEHTELRERFIQFREDELHHRDVAIEEGAKEAPGYGILSRVIRAGCHAAIRISEKV